MGSEQGRLLSDRATMAPHVSHAQHLEPAADNMDAFTKGSASHSYASGTLIGQSLWIEGAINHVTIIQPHIRST